MTTTSPDRFAFEVRAEDGGSRARTGFLATPHGGTPTPVFMPVGTQATVKALTPGQIRDTGATLILCNTFHLHERPGEEIIASLGGLQRFMGHDGPILTDSGGYQVLSLAALRRIDDDGVTFRSPRDGRERRLTPEIALDIQIRLGADILMAFDECIAWPSPRADVERAVERTLAWARRSVARHPRDGRAVFGIGQGGVHADLRRACLDRILELPFDGFALGGLWVGEERGAFLEMIEVSTERIPRDRPRYLMGVGSPPEILDAVERGIDMFDCVLPTRNARNGQALTPEGPLRLRNAAFISDARPLSADCPCLACRDFTRAYLRHLVMAKEILGATLLTLHNLTFMSRLMASIRTAIEEGRFLELKRAFLDAYAGRTGR